MSEQLLDSQDVHTLTQPPEQVREYFIEAQRDHEKMQQRKGKLIWKAIYRASAGGDLDPRVREAKLMRDNQLKYSKTYAEQNLPALKEQAATEARADGKKINPL